jgi:hypothetical protein
MDADARRRIKPIAKLLDHTPAASRRKDLERCTPARGLLNTKDHDLVILIDGRPEGEPRPLPDGDPWRARFRPLESLSAYATTFRYSLSPAPRIDDLRRFLNTLNGLHDTARAELLT